MVAAMTPRERQVLIMGETGDAMRNGVPTGALGSAGFVPGIPRLGVPPLQETDDSVGIANPSNARRRDVATALPSSLSLAATWDPRLADRDGGLLGDEAWRKGFNVLLGPGLNLARDPRNGRNFEYLGEDPLLAGTLAGAEICGIQRQHVVATVKHFALNDQETGRAILSANLSDAATRESDLLAFELALEDGTPGALMCAYNRVNGTYACENAHLLNEILKHDWRFAGWVMSDWGAVRSVTAANDGLDQESAANLDSMKLALGAIPEARLLDMNRRILRSMFAAGLFDAPPQRAPIDYRAHGAVALEAAQRGIVLLKNNGVLPLQRSIARIAVIGGYADAGVLSGGGSSQVMPVGHPFDVPLGGNGRVAVYDRSPPLDAIRSGTQAAVSFVDGRSSSAAAEVARRSDVAIVFATQWCTEGADLFDLALPNGQDALISAVAAANPNTVVVLETGNPVTMPWLDRVAAVLEAWYPGQRGGEAIANVLFGRVDATGRLPITFPSSEAQLVRPKVPGIDALLSAIVSGLRGYRLAVALRPFSVDYVEGSDVGYRRLAKQNLTPLFAFGHGLSYTRFRYSDFRVTGGNTLRASFTVTNDGARAGTDTPQVYLTRKFGQAEMRLIGWSTVTLAPDASRNVTVTADPRLLADFDATAGAWRVREGMYEASLGAASDALQFHAGAPIAGQMLRP
ncbi:MAG: glycoside hydrolase family 3 C-terminal domain-containing protein [Candidatus Eremiobacteraeota bacterium]|nr:glycoside hydrolase family 3 C-terminal domain-containing protein [Candidatus Eremiobacteraeota bacterium]